MNHAASLDLVRQAKHGDESAFTTLLRPLLEAAFRLAVGMLQDRQLAEDAVQEAAMKAWRKLDQLREDSDVRPWFLGIVANEARTTRRGSWWRVVKGGTERRQQQASEEAVVEGIDVRNALRRLSSDQRLVIVLYFYLDLPLEQIAIITGSSYAAARGRLYRGLRRLRADFPIPEAS